MNNRILYLLFALSGVAGLIYEGTWARYLKLFLGHSSYGQILTLCIYMGGLAIGSFIAGRLLSRIRKPLRAYALTELGIGLGGLLYHPLYLAVTEGFYNASWSRSLGSQGAELVKLGLAIATTLPVAILLGMTFPFIAAGLARRDQDSGRLSLPRLYFTNSMGAAVGILAASYLLIPYLGNAATLGVASGINFILLAVFWNMDQRYAIPENRQASVHPLSVEEEAALTLTPAPAPRVWLWVAAITGLTSFIYEVAWIRILSLLMGSSSHSFDQMLSAFILGLSLGSIASSRFLKRDPLKLLAMAQILMAFFALCTLYFHAPFFHIMNEAHQVFNQTPLGYVAWSLLKYGLSVIWMVPTSFFAGMTLPLLTLILNRTLRSEAPIGKVYGWNTLGAIAGAVIGGLLLIPHLQLKGTLVVAALADMAIGVWLLVRYRSEYRTRPVFWGLLFLALFPIVLVRFDPHMITSGVFRAFKAFEPNESITVRHGKTATISFHESPVHIYVKTNGKADASLRKDRTLAIAGDELTQAATAFIPIAMFNQPYDAAMIGLGSGMGSHYLLADPLLRRLDCVEIEQEMVNLARGFMPFNHRSFDDPRMFLHVDDARTFFHTAGRNYDLIVSVPSNPWVSGVSSLFSQEFYHHIKRYIKPGGHLVQWLQTYEFNNVLLLHILKALDNSFTHVSVYRAPEEPDIIIVAGDSPARQDFIDRFHTDPVLIAEFERIHRPWYFFGEQNFLFTTKSIATLLKDIEPNSEFVPRVDSKAEQARFVNNTAGLIQAFDSCQVCWPALLDSADYAPRAAFRHWLEASLPRDSYLERNLLHSLENDSTLDWFRFWPDFRQWASRIPFSAARDTIPLYGQMQAKVAAGQVPLAISLEFEFLDHAAHKRYQDAARMIPTLRQVFKLETMDEFFLRHLTITALLAGDKDDLRRVYLESIRRNVDFDPAERRMIVLLADVPTKILTGKFR